jgi:hypothetical protein
MVLELYLITFYNGISHWDEPTSETLYTEGLGNVFFLTFYRNIPCS